MSPEFEHVAEVSRARRAIVEVCRSMHQRGLIAAADGNVSVRIGERRMLVTPSGARKGHLTPEDLVLCDMSGVPLRGESRRPSSEIQMHVLIYASRPDVNAVVHAHPPCAIAHTIAGVSLSAPLMPEVFCELGEIAMVPYTTPTTAEVPAALKTLVAHHVAFVMERHGTITVGDSLGRAYDRLEVLEHAARISILARSLSPSGVESLDGEKLHKLRVFLGCGLGL